MNQPLVSIIIPTFNRSHLIGETLDSIIAQSYEKWECIIVDDGSTDDSFKVIGEYVRKDQRFSFYKRPSDKLKGPSSCRNYGLSKSEGKYLIFLDSDDLLAETCLEKRVETIEKNDILDFVVFSMGFFETTNRLEIDHGRKIFQGNREDTIKHFIAHKYPWNTTRPIYKKEFIDSLGGFNEELLVFTDPELAFRILLTKKDFKYLSIDITDCFYRVDSNYKVRYKSESFKKFREENYVKFLDQVFSLLKQEKKMIYQNELRYMFYKFCSTASSFKSLEEKKIIELFRKNVSLSLLDKIFLKIAPILNSKKNQRGYYRLNKYCKQYFARNIIKE